MRVIFLSDKLPVDSSWRPLSDLLEFTELAAPNALERMRAQMARAQTMAREATRAGVHPTFVLVMPENVLQHWRKLQDEYTGERILCKEQMRNLIDIDHPEWKRMHIAISTAIPFFLTQVSVQATDFQRFILDRDRIREGQKKYQIPVYRDDIHGA